MWLLGEGLHCPDPTWHLEPKGLQESRERAQPTAHHRPSVSPGSQGTLWWWSLGLSLHEEWTLGPWGHCPISNTPAGHLGQGNLHMV